MKSRHNKLIVLFTGLSLLLISTVSQAGISIHFSHGGYGYKSYGYGYNHYKGYHGHYTPSRYKGLKSRSRVHPNGLHRWSGYYGKIQRRRGDISHGYSRGRVHPNGLHRWSGYYGKIQQRRGNFNRGHHNSYRNRYGGHSKHHR